MQELLYPNIYRDEYEYQLMHLLYKYSNNLSLFLTSGALVSVPPLLSPWSVLSLLPSLHRRQRDTRRGIQQQTSIY